MINKIFKNRKIIKPKYKKDSFVYNTFRFFESIFGRKKGIRAECSAGRIKDEKGERTYLIHHTWESYLTHKEFLLRDLLNYAKHLSINIPFELKVEKVYLTIPSFALALAGFETENLPKRIPVGYVFAIGYVGQGAYAAAAPQDTTYDNSASFTITVSGTNPFLVMGQNVQSGNVISAVKWDSAGVNETMDQLLKLDAGSTGFYGFNYIYYKKAPSAGTSKRITATLSSSTFDRANATCFSGVHQTDPIESFNAVNANASTNSLSMEIYNTNCWGWSWFIKDNALSTGSTQPTGYAVDTGPDAAQTYSNATLSTGTNTLVWSTNTGNQRNTQLAVAFRDADTAIPTLRVKLGTYTGTGGTSGTRSITGIGFQPKFMLVWSGDTGEVYPVWAMQSAIDGLGNCGAFLGENGWFTTTTADRFQSFDADGFTFSIGSSTSASLKALNKSGVTFYYLAIGGVDAYSGVYTGNNTDNRNITGIGFQPGLVWLMGGSRHATFKTTATGISTDSSQFMYNGSNASNNIQALQSDGFQVGTAVQANENSIAYYYIAIKDGATSLNSGQYTGNGSDNRDITGVGFQPTFVFIKGAGTQNSVLRSSSHSGDLSKHYRSSGFFADRIQSLLSDGFQVGTAGEVNTNGVVYSYFALKEASTGGGGGGGSSFTPKTIVF